MENGSFTVVLVYVDDFLVASNNMQKIQATKDFFIILVSNDRSRKSQILLRS